MNRESEYIESKSKSQKKLKMSVDNFSSAQNNSKFAVISHSFASHHSDQVVVFIPELMSASDFYHDWIKEFMHRSQLHFPVLSLDMVGHGLSHSRRHDIENYQFWINDLEKLFRNLSLKHSVVHVIAHGLSSALFLKMLTDREGDFHQKMGKIFLINFATHFVFKDTIYSQMDRFSILRDSVPLFRIPNPLDVKCLFSQDEIRNHYITNPFCFDFLTLRAFWQIKQMQDDFYQSSYFLKKHCYFLLSQKNDSIDRSRQSLFLRGIDKKYKTFLKYQTSKHYLLHEVEGKKVIDDIITLLGGSV
jgi:pimeloyl-ACP methyl ester carboxylesterase